MTASAASTRRDCFATPAPAPTCREQRTAPARPPLLQVLRPEEIVPLAISGMRPVGQYAYSIEFSDGHSSGIYTLEYLRELA